jgi:hypothetical protein
MVKKKAKKAAAKKAVPKKAATKKAATKKAKSAAKKPAPKRAAAKKTKKASPPKPATAPTHAAGAVDSIEGGWDGGVDDVSGVAEPLDGFDEAGI